MYHTRASLLCWPAGIYLRLAGAGGNRKKVMIVANMTAKQQRFCDEYLVDLDGTQAAIRAGYSAKTAAAIASENLRKPNIRAYIDRRMAEKDETLVAKQDEVMKYLTAVMRREYAESVVVTVTEEKSYYEPDENGTMRKRSERKEKPQVVEIPAMLRDANKAAELLGRAYGLFTDKLSVDADMDLNITVNYGDGGT